MAEEKNTKKRKIMGAAWLSAPKRVPGTPLVTSQKPWATCPAAGRACRRRGLSERWIGGGSGFRASENATGYTNKAGDSPLVLMSTQRTQKMSAVGRGLVISQLLGWTPPREDRPRKSSGRRSRRCPSGTRGRCPPSTPS